MIEEEWWNDKPVEGYSQSLGDSEKLDYNLMTLKTTIDYINKIKKLKLDPKVIPGTHDELIDDLTKIVRLIKLLNKLDWSVSVK
jgi:hypothetical protein